MSSVHHASLPSSRCHTPENQAADGGHDDHQGHEGNRFPRSDNAADHQHVGQAQRRTGQQQGQGRSLAHAGTDESLEDGNFGKGGKIHERPHDRGKQVGPQRVSAHQTADPLGGNQSLGTGPPQQQPRHQHPDQEQRHDLLGEIPGGGEPRFGFSTGGGLQHDESHQADGESQQGILGNDQGRHEHRYGGDHQFVGFHPHPTDHQHPQQEGEPTGQPPFDGEHGRPEAAGLLRAPPGGGDQQPDHGGEQEGSLPQGTFHLGRGHVHGRGGLGRLLLAEQQMHEQPDDHTEDDSPHGAGHTDIRPQDACGEDDGQHIDRRTGVEKSDGRSQAGAALPDAGKQRQHRTGTDGQDRAGNAGHPVGEHLAGAGAQVFHHRALGDEDRHPSGNEERRHQAEQDMFLGIPFGQGQGLDHRMAETGVIHGQEEEEQKTADDHGKRFPDRLPVDEAGCLRFGRRGTGRLLRRTQRNHVAHLASSWSCPGPSGNPDTASPDKTFLHRDLFIYEGQKKNSVLVQNLETIDSIDTVEQP
ncbi:hypothetical protein DESC_370203 [Desulfosarcina cetonica]|nr:hypothetical protein DESC_370203 [Desulfosarcina cetonica]